MPVSDFSRSRKAMIDSQLRTSGVSDGWLISAMGKISREDFKQLSRASQRLADLPLYIDDTPALSISALRTRARRLKRRHDIGMIVVDYLQLLQGSGRGQDNRVNEISEISRGLKTLAKELQVPVIALSQLSRAVEQREPRGGPSCCGCPRPHDARGGRGRSHQRTPTCRSDGRTNAKAARGTASSRS